MLLPKIKWNDGSDHTLIPSYPPTQKPGTDERSIARYDTITVSGKKQSAYMRTDIFRSLQFAFVPFSDYGTSGGTDGWLAFFAFAETGAPFTYYPDSTNEPERCVHRRWRSAILVVGCCRSRLWRVKASCWISGET